MLSRFVRVLRFLVTLESLGPEFLRPLQFGLSLILLAHLDKNLTNHGVRLRHLIVVVRRVAGEIDRFLQSRDGEIRAVGLDILLAEIKKGIGIVWLQLHRFFQIVFSGGKITVFEINYSQEECAEELFRINRQLLLEKRKGCREAFFFSLSKICQGEIVVNSRIMRV